MTTSSRSGAEADASARKASTRFAGARAGKAGALLFPARYTLEWPERSRLCLTPDCGSAHIRHDYDTVYVTRRGKYGGDKRKPIRGGRSVQPRAIVSAAPSPCVGTNPSDRAAAASRQPATST